MHDAGYRVTIVGHSLGAGAASLLAVALRGRGLQRVRCYAFANPNCAGIQLCSSCADYVTSVVFRDDIVTRVSPEALAGLQRQLLDFDMDGALQKVLRRPLKTALAQLPTASRSSHRLMARFLRNRLVVVTRRPAGSSLP